MRLGKDLSDKPIYSVTEGRQLGRVKDFYLDNNLEKITALFLGSEGLFSRKSLFIQREQVTLLGLDVVLTVDSDVVIDEKQILDLNAWVKRENLVGRQVDTTGGTRVGVIGDVIVDNEGQVVGFKLARVNVEGPIARKQAIAREVVTDTGGAAGVMTIDMPRAEQHELSLG
jgi:sporulation protein YlmC with PRC-barrel domain